MIRGSIFVSNVIIIAKQCQQLGTPHLRKSHRRFSNQNLDWIQAVSEAEKIVNYSMFSSTLNWIFNENTYYIKNDFLKIIVSNQSALKNILDFFNYKHNKSMDLGLIVLLLSKTARNLKMTNKDKYHISEILRNQRTLADAVQMIYFSFFLQNHITDAYNTNYPTLAEKEDMILASRFFLMCADYLYVKSYSLIAEMKNQDLAELISSAVRDMAESYFIQRFDEQDNPSFYNAATEWTLYHGQRIGSLLGKMCQGTLKLAEHDEFIQQQGYIFGKHWSLAWTASSDLIPFLSNNTTSINLYSAPVMFEIEHDPTILEEIKNGLDINSEKMFDKIISGSGIELSKKLFEKHSQKAMEVLNVFEMSDAKVALSNLTLAMGNIIQK